MLGSIHAAPAPAVRQPTPRVRQVCQFPAVPVGGQRAARVLVAMHRNNQPGAPGEDTATPVGACLAERLACLPAYLCTSVRITNLQELEQGDSPQAPRVVIIDAALFAAADDAAIREIHRRMPQVEWVLAWEALTEVVLDVVVRSRARGCVEWSSSTDHVAMALGAVLAGDLWFPRQLLHTLYFLLLHAAPADSDLAATGQQVQSSGAPSTDRPLTHREIQTLGLMRQGLTNKQISERLAISVSTVKKHLEHVFDKQGLHRRRQLRG